MTDQPAVVGNNQNSGSGQPKAPATVAVCGLLLVVFAWAAFAGYDQGTSTARIGVLRGNGMGITLFVTALGAFGMSLLLWIPGFFGLGSLLEYENSPEWPGPHSR